MSSGYDKYTCCYYQQIGEHGFVEVKGNACATCLSKGNGHQGTSMSLRNDNIALTRQHIDVASTSFEWLESQSRKAPGAHFKNELSVGESGEGPMVAFTPRRGDLRARRF